MPEVHDPTSWLGAGATGAPKDIIVVVYLYLVVAALLYVWWRR